MNNWKIALSFDLEEFDTPLEYGQNLDLQEQIDFSVKGCNEILKLLAEFEIKGTFFTTACFAENEKQLVQQISKKHEIASHSFYHSSFTKPDLAESKRVLEEITNTEIKGFRMPRLMTRKKCSFADLKLAGYQYDSSVNPTFIPGRYNNLDFSRTAFKDENGLYIMPVSVTPFFRFPLFWISFKNLPLAFYLSLSVFTLKRDNYLILYFHPWEFADLANIKIPNYLKNPSGEALIIKLRKYINYFVSQKAQFITHADLMNTF